MRADNPGRPDSSETVPAPPGYQPLAALGKGRGATVLYKAQREEDGAMVAIKAFKAEVLTKFGAASAAKMKLAQERFIREGLALAQLSHDHVAKVYQLLQDPRGNAFIVMEFVEGVSLEDLLKAGQTFSPERAAKIIADAASALHHAHERGILHRDIKPSAFMIEARTNRVKLASFGLAKIAGAEKITQAGFSLGTLHYMSPEQLLGKDELDARSDVYSLCVVLYQLLTGRLPFQDSNPVWLADSIRFAPPESPRLTHPQIPVELEKALLRGLEKKPENRFETARSLERTVRRFGGESPAPIRPALARPAPSMPAPAPAPRPAPASPVARQQAPAAPSFPARPSSAAIPPAPVQPTGSAMMLSDDEPLPAHLAARVVFPKRVSSLATPAPAAPSPPPPRVAPPRLYPQSQPPSQPLSSPSPSSAPKPAAEKYKVKTAPFMLRDPNALGAGLVGEAMVDTGGEVLPEVADLAPAKASAPAEKFKIKTAPFMLRDPNALGAGLLGETLVDPSGEALPEIVDAVPPQPAIEAPRSPAIPPSLSGAPEPQIAAPPAPPKKRKGETAPIAAIRRKKGDTGPAPIVNRKVQTAPIPTLGGKIIDAGLPRDEDEGTDDIFSELLDLAKPNEAEKES
jgi:serine/threonine protein kinase